MTIPADSVITDSSEWTIPLLRRFEQEIGAIAAGYGLDTYPNQLEVITAEQMIDAYAATGMPVGYHHWSYGKRFVATEQTYRRGQMGLAYEIVINSNPCIAYLMEENTMAMQALVIAHACFGHNSFFKGNYLFRSWTDPEGILDYLVYARDFVAECEERHGTEAVEGLLDACHALMPYGVDRYRRPAPLSAAEERRRQQEREAYQQSQVNELWRTLPARAETARAQAAERFPAEPQENLLQFVEEHAPLLEPWERGIVRIVRKLGQYFYPQRQTQVMNEGWATFWHYTLIHALYDRGLINDGFMLELLQAHTSVTHQPPYDSPWYSGLNPYALGFAMFRDIRRVCSDPSDEDRAWFPDLAGRDWREGLEAAMRDFKDESFIRQYLSPKVMRDLRLFTVIDDDRADWLEVGAIHDENGYRALRAALAEQHDLGTREPVIQVYAADLRGDRTLTLRHSRYNRTPLGESTASVLRHLHRLWGFTVRMESLHEDGYVELVGQWPRSVELLEGLG